MKPDVLGQSSGNLIRKYPYPFSHLISIASDVDYQSPARGAAIHRFVNETMGLPITDSVWVQQGCPTKKSKVRRLLKACIESANLSSFVTAPNLTPAFFTVSDNLNDAPSGVANHPIFWLLVRQWHRGNIDHLHSWQSDLCPQLVYTISPPAIINSNEVSLQVPPAPQEFSRIIYTHLRLYFSEPLNIGLNIVLTDTNGNEIFFDSDAVSDGGKVQFKTGKESIVELIVVLPDLAQEREGKQFNLGCLAAIKFAPTGKVTDKQVKLIRIERDNFSRLTMLKQASWLETFNIRPSLLTCHGGLTHAQNFSPSDYIHTLDRKEKQFQRDDVLSQLRSTGNIEDSHAYHVDILNKLGVDHIWGYGGSDHLWNQPYPSPEQCYERFYNFRRTTLLQYDTSSVATFKNGLIKQEPGLDKLDLNYFYSGKYSAGDQGNMIGLLVAAGLTLVDDGQPVHHCWYTHFSSGPPIKRFINRHLIGNRTVKWIKKLANYYYNFDGTIELDRRVWTPPAGALARYQVVVAQIHKGLTVDFDSSKISIRQWADSVTDRKFPDPKSGSRDIQGLTIYVSDSKKASVFIDDSETKYFTKNPADQTGRESITIVDDNAPTVILSSASLNGYSSIIVENAELNIKRPVVSANSPEFSKSLVSLEAKENGDAIVSVRPKSLFLWNTSHIYLSYKKSSNTSSTASMFVELIFERGRHISIIEKDKLILPNINGAGWWIEKAPSGANLTHHILATHSMDWNESRGGWFNRKPPHLPIGRVNEMIFGLKGARPGDRLDIAVLQALRASSNGESPDCGKLVAGRVTYAGIFNKPAANITVEAVSSIGDCMNVKTDRFGYYYFSGVPRGQTLAISAIIDNNKYSPMLGDSVEILKNEAELDISIDTRLNSS
jgi:hypothetical protein